MACIMSEIDGFDGYGILVSVLGGVACGVADDMMIGLGFVLVLVLVLGYRFLSLSLSLAFIRYIVRSIANSLSLHCRLPHLHPRVVDRLAAALR